MSISVQVAISSLDGSYGHGRSIQLASQIVSCKGEEANPCSEWEGSPQQDHCRHEPPVDLHKMVSGLKSILCLSPWVVLRGRPSALRKLINPVCCLA